MNSIKIISRNVNGIRAVQKKGFDDFIIKYKPDILCIQETKAHPDQVDLELPKYKNKFWNSAEKKGYSGTLIFSKIKPLSYFYGMGIPFPWRILQYCFYVRGYSLQRWSCVGIFLLFIDLKVLSMVS